MIGSYLPRTTQSDQVNLFVVTFPDPHSLVSAAGGQQVARWGPGNTLHLILMPLQHRQTLRITQYQKVTHGLRPCTGPDTAWFWIRVDPLKSKLDSYFPIIKMSTEL